MEVERLAKAERLLCFLGCFFCSLFIGNQGLHGLELVQVETGTFEMGINADEELPVQVYKKYTPKHTVELTRRFLVAVRETTIAEYIKVLDWGVQTGRVWKIGQAYSLPWFGRVLFDLTRRVHVSGQNLSVSSLTKTDWAVLPVVNVTWYSAAVYCNLKSSMEELESCYDQDTWTCDMRKDGYRLPTEAEWFWAYRGGIKSKGYRYSGGDNPEEVGWFSENTAGLKPVARKTPNELGLYDMAGNVSEWTNDWFGLFGNGEVLNPIGPSAPNEPVLGAEYGKVKLGGSWNFPVASMLPILRGAYPPDTSDFAVGFRVVRNR